jgi:hypothetical protein
MEGGCRKFPRKQLSVKDIHRGEKEKKKEAPWGAEF